jgi:hypothetical protein
MPKHSGNLCIRPELVEQASKDYNLATRQAHCIDHVISDNDHLPIDPIEMACLWLRSPCLPTVPALSDPPVIQNLVVSLGRRGCTSVLAWGPIKHRGARLGIAVPDAEVGGDIAIPIRGVLSVGGWAELAPGEATVDGADDLRGDKADADAVGVKRGQDLGPELLLELGELGFPELALELGREDDEVGAVGVGHGLEVAEVDGDRPAAGDEDRRGELPLVVVPPGPAAAPDEMYDLLVPQGGVEVTMVRRGRRDCRGGTDMRSDNEGAAPGPAAAAAAARRRWACGGGVGRGWSASSSASSCCFYFPLFLGGFFRAAFDRYGVFGLFSEVVEAAARNPDCS